MNKHESCVCCVSVGVVNENNLPKMSECKNNVKSLHKTAVNGHVGKNEAITVAADSANSTNTAGTLALVVYLCPNWYILPCIICHLFVLIIVLADITV